VQPLSPEATEGDVLQALSQFGSVTHCHVVRQHASGRSKGFAYATFECETARRAAISSAAGIRIGKATQSSFVRDYVNSMARVRTPMRAQAMPKPTEPHTDAASIYVGQLPDSIASEAQLRVMFSEYGTIVSTAVKGV
jgi:RNA recognition motif-containing protein